MSIKCLPCRISPIMQELRFRLDAEGIEWLDASEEDRAGSGCIWHMERTKIMRDGAELASCIYGYSGIDGCVSGTSYGWPYMIESMDEKSGPEPVPRTVDEIMEVVR